MTDEMDWEALARFLAGECSPAEQARWEARLRSDDSFRMQLNELRVLWDFPMPTGPDVDTDRLWQETARKAGISLKSQNETAPPLETLERTGRGFLGLNWTGFKWAAAALSVIAVGIAVGWGVRSLRSSRPEPMVNLSVEHGRQTELVLSDGSRVVLDAGSRFEYPKNFRRGLRTVSLHGEAYFEIVPSDNPFLVSAEGAEVRVLGTRFNVRAWAGEEAVTVTVAEGRISLNAEGRPSEGVVLSSGQMSVLPPGGLPSPPRSADVDGLLGWMRREAVFEDMPLKSILVSLERWYDVHFVLLAGSEADERLNMHLQDDPLADVLELLETLTGLRSRRTGKTVFLEPRH